MMMLMVLLMLMLMLMLVWCWCGVSVRVGALQGFVTSSTRFKARVKESKRYPAQAGSTDGLMSRLHHLERNTSLKAKRAPRSVPLIDLDASRITPFASSDLYVMRRLNMSLLISRA
jgi:hypothetical protein